MNTQELLPYVGNLIALASEGIALVVNRDGNPAPDDVEAWRGRVSGALKELDDALGSLDSLIDEKRSRDGN